ncbi:MAG: SDR family NAD(P)-dependent oxidoreductase [Calditrichia bacterium]|nr:SDR family NAD(P)-dependent oxidoreductase [Calditrichia bacterium]
MKKETILITGANGFIGSHIAEKFVHEGQHVICLVREESDLSNIKHLNIELRYGDVRNEEGLKEQLEGIDFVIHNAAYVKDWGDWKTFEEINIKGTLNILKACLDNGIKNIIITGSISSYGEENSTKVKNENDEFNSHYPYLLDRVFPCKMNYYRDSKAIATKEAVKFAKNKNINLTILEPVWVYGEREFNTGFYEYVKDVKNGLPFVPGLKKKKNKFHMVYAGDVARAYFLAYEKKLKGVNRIIIGNEKAEYMENTYNLFCREAGLKKPANLPKWLLYLLAFKLELFYTIFKAKDPPFLTRGRLNMFYDNIEYSTEKAQKILSFKNEFSLEEGIKRTVKWYKDNGYL